MDSNTTFQNDISKLREEVEMLRKRLTTYEINSDMDKLKNDVEILQKSMTEILRSSSEMKTELNELHNQCRFIKVEELKDDFVCRIGGTAWRIPKDTYHKLWP